MLEMAMRCLQCTTPYHITYYKPHNICCTNIVNVDAEAYESFEFRSGSPDTINYVELEN